MVRGYQRDLSSKSMLATMSRALCNNGMMALFGISQLTSMSDTDPSSPKTEEREEMITKFKIPRNACMYERERGRERERETFKTP